MALTVGLQKHIEQFSGADEVFVEIEIAPSAIPKDLTAEARAALLRETFSEISASVIDAIGIVGGDVLWTSWVTHTVGARLTVAAMLHLTVMPDVRGGIIDLLRERGSDFAEPPAVLGHCAQCLRRGVARRDDHSGSCLVSGVV